MLLIRAPLYDLHLTSPQWQCGQLEATPDGGWWPPLILPTVPPTISN